jgi:hypothetical protein
VVRRDRCREGAIYMCRPEDRRAPWTWRWIPRLAVCPHPVVVQPELLQPEFVILE